MAEEWDYYQDYTFIMRRHRVTGKMEYWACEAWHPFILDGKEVFSSTKLAADELGRVRFK